MIPAVSGVPRGAARAGGQLGGLLVVRRLACGVRVAPGARVVLVETGGLRGGDGVEGRF